MQEHKSVQQGGSDESFIISKQAPIEIKQSPSGVDNVNGASLSIRYENRGNPILNQPSNRSEENFSTNIHQHDSTSNSNSNSNSNERPSSKCPLNLNTCILSQETMLILYLSSFAIIGSTIRLYLTRIFGLDCSSPPSQQDYIYFLSMCLTSTGTVTGAGLTNQGAVFIDLPANMLGSLLMGLMIPSSTDREKHIPTMPWLKPNHILQSNTRMHVALQTGLCGSLTTFASWNSQMVVMLVGYESDTRVVQALAGYLFGVICSISSFQFGRHLAKNLFHWRGGRKSGADASTGNENGDENDNENGNGADAEEEGKETRSLPNLVIGGETNIGQEEELDKGQERSSCFQKMTGLCDIVFNGTYSPLVFATMLMLFFLIGDFEMNNHFHKQLWVSALLSPPGTLLRWKLSKFNGKWFQNSRRYQWRYIPFGTLLANVIGCIISIACAAVVPKLNGYGSSMTVTASAELWLGGIKSGFAGNLSTISSFVKEVVILSEKNEVGAAHLYATGSVVICCLVGLLVYIPIVNFY